MFRKVLAAVLSAVLLCAGIPACAAGEQSRSLSEDFSGYNAENIPAYGYENRVAAASDAPRLAANAADREWLTSTVNGPASGTKAAGYAYVTSGGLFVKDTAQWYATVNLRVRNFTVNALQRADFVTRAFGDNTTGVRLAVSAEETSYIEFGYNRGNGARTIAGVTIPKQTAYAVAVSNGSYGTPVKAAGEWGLDAQVRWTVTVDGGSIGIDAEKADDPSKRWTAALIGGKVPEILAAVKYPAAAFTRGDGEGALVSVALEYTGVVTPEQSDGALYVDAAYGKVASGGSLDLGAVTPLAGMVAPGFTGAQTIEFSVDGAAYTAEEIFFDENGGALFSGAYRYIKLPEGYGGVAAVLTEAAGTIDIPAGGTLKYYARFGNALNPNGVVWSASDAAVSASNGIAQAFGEPLDPVQLTAVLDGESLWVYLDISGGFAYALAHGEAEEYLGARRFLADLLNDAAARGDTDGISALFDSNAEYSLLDIQPLNAETAADLKRLDPLAYSDFLEALAAKAPFAFADVQDV
ncbi:MAG: hypothetical protein LBH54_04090, partial [Clostridiales bacterium]|nr:hypothetical protein [Clostridiales bacterium]